MKRKQQLRKTRRKTRKTRRIQRGGTDIVFKVVVFSDEELSSATKKSIQDALTDLYGKVNESEIEIPYKNDFLTMTGLKRLANADAKVETHVTIQEPPAFLQKNIDSDTLLTALEGQIQNKLMEKKLDVSLLPVQHGLHGDFGPFKQFYVGLCTPACFKKYPIYSNIIIQVTA
jgi:hypothetical protein